MIVTPVNITPLNTGIVPPWLQTGPVPPTPTDDFPVEPLPGPIDDGDYLVPLPGPVIDA